MKKELFTIIVKNSGGYEIDKYSTIAEEGAKALMQYLKEEMPPLEKGDTIEIQ